MPASFRQALASQAFQGIVAFRSFKYAAIEGFGYDRMEQLSQTINSNSFFSAAQDDLATAVFADAQLLPFDGEGRVSLPESLLLHAHITDNAVFVGKGPTFQIWNPADFEIYQTQARQRFIEASHRGGAL